MANFSSMVPEYNSGSDAAPSWQTLAFAGSSGANEIRWCASGAGGGSTTSADWPQYARPASVEAVPECWGFATNGSGVKVGTYDGGKTNSNVFRVNFDNLGTFALPPTLSAWSDSSHTTPDPGTQPGTESGSPIINGDATDTGSTSSLKGNSYGTTQTSDLAAGAAGSTLAATSGTAGSVSPSVDAWLATWQSLQGAEQYITHPSTPDPLTAGKLFFSLALFTGPHMSLGTMLPVVTFTYSYT